MFTQGYSIFEWPGHLQFVWTNAVLPLPLLAGAILVLLLSPFAFVFRGPAASFAGRHLHLPLTPRSVGIGAAVFSALAGLLLLFAGPPARSLVWDFGPDGIEVKNFNGKASMAWKEVASARLNESDDRRKEVSLVLKSKEGQEAWLVLSWITDAHRALLEKFLTSRADGLFPLPAIPQDEDPAASPATP